MFRNRLFAAIVVLAVTQVPAFGQVAAQVFNNGQSSLTVEPGPVALQLDIRLESSVPLAVVEFTLDSSEPTLFAYGSPPMVLGTPWDLTCVMSPRPIVVDELLSNHPDVILFKPQEPDFPAESFPAIILSYNIKSVSDLPAGATYTFSIDGVGLPPIWARVLEDGTIESGDIDNTAIFTLTVTGDSGGGGGGTSDGDSGDTGDGTDTGDTGDTGGTTDGSTDGTGTGDSSTDTSDGAVDTDTGSTDQADDNADTAGTDDSSDTSTSEEPEGQTTAPRAFCGSGVGGGFMLATVAGLCLLPRRRRGR